MRFFCVCLCVCVCACVFVCVFVSTLFVHPGPSISFSAAMISCPCSASGCVADHCRCGKHTTSGKPHTHTHTHTHAHTHTHTALRCSYCGLCLWEASRVRGCRRDSNPPLLKENSHALIRSVVSIKHKKTNSAGLQSVTTCLISPAGSSADVVADWSCMTMLLLFLKQFLSWI